MCGASGAVSSTGTGSVSQDLARGQLTEIFGSLAESSVLAAGLPEASQPNADVGHEAMEWDEIFSDNPFEIDPLFGWLDIPLDPSFSMGL